MLQLRANLALLILGLFVPTLGGCGLQRFEYTQLSMGVPVRMVVYAPSESAAFDACKAAYGRFNQINDVASDYKLDSELMRLCHKSGQGPVPVSQDLFLLLDRSTHISWQSGGVFDCTVGPLVKLWRKARKDGQMPAPADIEAARALVGWQKIKLNPIARTAELTQPGMLLDMGGIAKGYGCDCALQTLAEHGISAAMIEAGGEIVLGDAPPGAPGWRIVVTGGAGQADQPMDLHNCAVSTSGDTEQFVIIDGQRYSHVVDPRTGVGVTNRIMSTVIARYGIDADALTKPCEMLDSESAGRIVGLYPGARFIRRAMGAN